MKSRRIPMLTLLSLCVACSPGNSVLREDGGDAARTDEVRDCKHDIGDCYGSAESDIADAPAVPDLTGDVGGAPHGDSILDGIRDSVSPYDGSPDVQLDSAVDVPMMDGASDAHVGCDCGDPALVLTVNSIPSDMNGSVPFTDNNNELKDFKLALPQHGFIWDLALDCPCGCSLEGVNVRYSSVVGEWSANLSDNFVSGADGLFHWEIPKEKALPEDEVTLRASVVDYCGNGSELMYLDVIMVKPSILLDPFDIADPWLLTWSRDFLTIEPSVDPSTAHPSVQVTESPNGISDFQEDLWLIGLGTPNPTAEFAQSSCLWADDGNGCVLALLLTRVREQAYLIVGNGADGDSGQDGLPLIFYIEGEQDAPRISEYIPQTLLGAELFKGFSMMGFGGLWPGMAFVGYSDTVDLCNRFSEDNHQFRRGVFSTRLIDVVFQQAFANPDYEMLASMLLDDLVPAFGGVSLGEMPGDELVIDLTVPSAQLDAAGKARRQSFQLVLEVMGLGLAALMVHELGHSVGLVPKGPPPYGLFGGEQKASFIESASGSTGYHVDTPGLNLMQAGPGAGNATFSIEYLTSKFRFNELNWAYLKGRTYVLPEGP